jgi:hypothetical protein
VFLGNDSTNPDSAQAMNTATLTIGVKGTVEGTGYLNTITVVNPGGTIRGGIPDGTNNYGSLTFGSPGYVSNYNNVGTVTAAVSLQLLGATTANGGGGILQVEVNGAGTSNSTLNLWTGNVILGSSGSRVGTGTVTTAKSVVINLLETANTLATGTYTFQLVNMHANDATFPNTDYGVLVYNTNNGINFTGAGTIDSGNGAGLTTGLGNNRIVTFMVSGPNGTAVTNSITAWSLTTDSLGNLDLTVTSAVPEPEHIMLLCTGVLLAGFAVRRRWRQVGRVASFACPDNYRSWGF